jgi:hypothetical protein
MKNFKTWLEKRDKVILHEDHVQKILDDYIFFFKHGKEIYGADEGSRIIFSKMKEGVGTWMKEANFSAVDLKKKLKNEDSQRVFGQKDLKDIKVLDNKEVQKLLK